MSFYAAVSTRYYAWRLSGNAYPWVVGIELLELIYVMAKTSSNIYNKWCIRRLISTSKESLFDRINRGMHPRQSTLPVSAHYNRVSDRTCIPTRMRKPTMMIRLRTKPYGPEVLKTIRQVSLVRCMHGRVRSVDGVLPLGLTKELVELNRTAANTTDPFRDTCQPSQHLTSRVNSQGNVTIADDVETQRLGEVGELILVLAGLFEVTHCTDMSHETACMTVSMCPLFTVYIDTHRGGRGPSQGIEQDPQPSGASQPHSSP